MLLPEVAPSVGVSKSGAELRVSTPVAGTIEVALVFASGNGEGDGIGVWIGGGDGGNSCLVFSGVDGGSGSAAVGRDGRGLIDVGDGDGNGLHVGQRACSVVRGGDLDDIGVASGGGSVGRGFKVGRRAEVARR